LIMIMIMLRDYGELFCNPPPGGRGRAHRAQVAKCWQLRRSTPTVRSPDAARLRTSAEDRAHFPPGPRSTILLFPREDPTIRERRLRFTDTNRREDIPYPVPGLVWEGEGWVGRRGGGVGPPLTTPGVWTPSHTSLPPSPWARIPPPSGGGEFPRCKLGGM